MKETPRVALLQTGTGWYLTPLVFACDASREDATRHLKGGTRQTCSVPSRQEGFGRSCSL